MQLDDTVQFRWHWPLLSELHVNNVKYKVYQRINTTKLGANQRDEAANIGIICLAAENSIALICSDARPFVMGVQLARKRLVEDVKRMMPPALSLPDAIQHIKDQFKDDEVEMFSAFLSLKDPITGSRIQTPVKFDGTRGLVSFDLDTFLLVAERTRKWQCPYSMVNHTIYSLRVDTYTQHILEALKATPDILQVEISPEGE